MSYLWFFRNKEWCDKVTMITSNSLKPDSSKGGGDL